MGQYDFACNVGAEVVGSDGWADTLRVHCYWKCNGWRYNMSPVYGWVTCNGQERLVANGIAINFQNNQGQYELGYSDYRLDRRQGNYVVSYSARLRSDSSYTSGSRSSGSGSHTVGSLASHTVSYNANGGSGAPGAQTKWYGSVLTLSGTKPTRTGYTFQGWATSAGGGVAYQPGQAYGNDANITLYAVWKANTWTVKYNANGGSGAPADQTKTYGKTLKLSTSKPVRTNYNFMGWATSKANADKGTVTYAAGANYTANAAITLYAVWKLAYVRPRITNLIISRCDSAGNISESGTYLRYDFKWATDLTGVYIQCQWKPQTAAWGSSSQKSTTILSNSSSKSGTISKKVVGSGAISTEQSWTARVYIYDSKGTSYATYSSDMSIGTIAYPIDVRKGGKGIAFGKVAEADIFDVNMDTKIRGKLNANNFNIWFSKIINTASWLYIGNLKFNSQGQQAFINIYTGNGQNGKENQNTHAQIILKQGWTNESKPIGITTYFSQNYNINYRIVITHVSKTECDLYIYLPFAYNDLTFTINGSFISFTPSVTKLTKVPSFDKESTYYSFEPIELFSNNQGVKGTITLLDSAEKYKYIEIYYKHSGRAYGSNCAKIVNPNNQRVNLRVSGNDENSYITLYNSTVLISGKTISVVMGSGISITHTFDLGGFTAINEIVITKVLGYK